MPPRGGSFRFAFPPKRPLQDDEEAHFMAKFTAGTRSPSRGSIWKRRVSDEKPAAYEAAEHKHPAFLRREFHSTNTAGCLVKSVCLTLGEPYAETLSLTTAL